MGILEYLRSVATSGPVYIRIKTDWLSVRDMQSGKLFEEVPILAFAEGTTNLNWYGRLWAGFVLSEFHGAVLHMIRGRNERV